MNFFKPFFPIVLIFGMYVDSAFSQHRGIDTSLLDSTISPKADFYQFVNGKWIEQTELPADRGSWGTIDQIVRTTNENVLKSLKNAQIQNKYPNTSDQYKAIAFYELGMDTAYANQLGIQPVLPLLNKLKSVNSMEGLQAYLQEITALGLRGFFTLDVFPDFQNSQISSLFTFPGNQGLPTKDYYLNEDENSIKIRTAYKKHMIEMFLLSGYAEQEANEKANDVIAVEIRLATPMLSESEKRNPIILYNVKSFDELSAIVPHIQWRSFLSSIGTEDLQSVVVTEPAYLEEVGNFLTKENLPSIKNYLEWQLIHHAANYLSGNFVLATHGFYGKVLWGAQELQPREEAVINECTNQLGEAIGKIYIENYFSAEAKAGAEEMVQNILKVLAIRIENLDWMSQSTREEALKKIETMNVKMGYPDHWKDYRDLEVLTKAQGGSYFQNGINASQWNFAQKMKKAGKEVNRTEWDMPPQMVNAFYHPLKNQILFTAAILQPPFYDVNVDPAVNYGGIGAVIGHEISHGFDNMGSQFDANGEMRNWWTDEDRQAFNDRTQALVEQFNTYEPIPGVHINGQLTLGENISDLLGIQLAYDALQIHLTKNGNPGTIDGLSQDQRFFIAYTTLWRDISTDEALKIKINTGPHTPNKYRAIGPLENVDAFYETFEIGNGDPMYKPKEERTKIW